MGVTINSKNYSIDIVMIPITISRISKIGGVKVNYVDGVCQWKNCKVIEITEKEMGDCSWNNDCENCEMNTKSDSYDNNNN